MSGELTTDQVTGDGDGPAPLAQVDVIDLAQEAHRLLDTEFPGPRGERPDVLGQAAAAEAESRVEEAAPDAGVVSERIREGAHIGAGRVADLRHRVDERDLGREEGVRRDLDQLSGGGVGADVRDVGLEHGGVHLAQGPVRAR